MTQEDKELLIKDLCARLPYGVCCKHTTWDEELGEVEISVKIHSINHDGYVRNCYDDETIYIDRVKPYLFPLSSMTDEQYEEIWHCMEADNKETLLRACSGQKYANPYCNVADYYNAHHFDYRGLIEKGLANDATGLNIY